MSTFDLRTLILPTIFILYGIGYLIVGVLNVQSYWVGSFFKVPFLFSFLGARFSRILSGLVCIAGGIWFFTLMS
ncbi:MAG TPA: hypothetical protein PK530_02440 [Anaerolineales bacterium]|nr:hypothetical protein [Anaerolineales bacterium]